jgi:hypothetical protein
MSEPLILALVTSVPPTLAALATLVVALRGEKKIEKVHKATNSLTDRLLAATRIASHAEGVESERARQADREA